MKDETATPPAGPLIVRTLDLRGLSCPLPVLMTSKALRMAAPGEAVEVFATDPLASEDFSDLCRAKGHRLVSFRAEGGEFRFVIER